LLTYLIRHPGQLLTHDQVLEEVWGDQYGRGRDRGRLKLYIGYLRRKLEQVTGVVPIDTVRGLGYRYRSPLAR
jgi:DNA-binding response OmpR family regulator